MLSLDDPAVGGDDARRWTGNALVLGAIACEAVFLLLNKTLTSSPP